jgi:hypothetical protein
MHHLKLTILAIALQLGVTSLMAWAVPIANLYNTGLDSIGNYQPTGAPDGNYSVISSPSGPFTPIAVDDTLYPFPFWLANSPPISRWIGTAAQSSDGAIGNYIYRTSIVLPANVNTSSVVITGGWATDDPGIDIEVNALSNAQTSPSFGVLTPFTLTSGFQPGINNIDFIVQNAFGPTGLRIEGIKGNYSVPEPASLLLAVTSIGGMIMRRRV